MSPQELAQLVVKIKTDTYNKKQILLNSHNKKTKLKLDGTSNNRDEKAKKVLSDKIAWYFGRLLLFCS